MDTGTGINFAGTNFAYLPVLTCYMIWILECIRYLLKHRICKEFCNLIRISVPHSLLRPSSNYRSSENHHHVCLQKI